MVKTHILLFLILALELVCNRLQAQTTGDSIVIINKTRNVISTQPLKNIYFLNLAYQRTVNEYVDLGISTGIYQFGSSESSKINQFRFDPFVKFRFSPESKFYLMGKIIFVSRYDSYGAIDNEFTLQSDEFGEFLISSNEDLKNLRNEYVSSIGGGVSFGWQWFLGPRERFFLDLQLGLQFIEYPDKPLIINETTIRVDESGNEIDKEEFQFIEDNTLNRTLWSVFGAGSIIAPRIRIGYAF